MSKRKVTLELKLKVTFIPNGVSVKELKANLERLVSFGMGDGLLTGNTPAEVDTHSVSIKEE